MCSTIYNNDTTTDDTNSNIYIYIYIYNDWPYWDVAGEAAGDQW